MRPFDPLSPDSPLLGPHLVEASAGTGKTFSIEHIYVRLLLEGISLEEILAVTFTRAAARELKGRIRTNIEKALGFLRARNGSWGYLRAHFNCLEKETLLLNALSDFDRSQIFTIHGFCYRMLKECPFETQTGPLLDPDLGKKIPERLKEAALDFLRHGIEQKLLCPEQLALCFKQFDSIEEIGADLASSEEEGEGAGFEEVSVRCKTALQQWKGNPLEEDLLWEDFLKLEKNYKKGKGDFEPQVRDLARGGPFLSLFKQRGSLFDFLSPENRKVRMGESLPLSYPGFFEWARSEIAPLFKQNPFDLLQKAWAPIRNKILLEEDYLDPDGIIDRMKKQTSDPSFNGYIRKKYKAALIDEFQDTDPAQWEIFEKLFVDPPISALYLVGDPKQSIYRFRKADIYTYLKAADRLGEESKYRLDTNFRSSPQLVGALNALFNRDFLYLPKTGKTLPYFPVRAGKEGEEGLSDGKGAVHFIVSEGDFSSAFEEVFLPYAVSELEKVEGRSAFLVKDRFQAQKAVEFLQKRGISAIAKSSIPLGETEAFRAVEEFFEALFYPDDRNRVQIARRGPLADPNFCFLQARREIEEKGIVPLAKRLFLDPDGMQIFEHLFSWEREEGFSFQGIRRRLKEMKEGGDDPKGRRRAQVDEQAVQIMTLHISKGLEFDVVFALGLASPTPESKEAEESDAEKMRQLYVAMTRAKKRIYVPILQTNKNKEKGTSSPIELFSRYFPSPLIDEIHSLGQTESISIEKLSSPILLDPPVLLPNNEMKRGDSDPPLPFTPSYLFSFTALSKSKERGGAESIEPAPIIPTQGDKTAPLFDLKTMPRGAQTGIDIHKIFELIFDEGPSVWRNPERIRQTVRDFLKGSPLSFWEEPIEQMVEETLSIPLLGEGEYFTLKEIEKCQVEMEFIFSSPPHFIKGFIDLIFVWKEKIYFVDWKTNSLPDYESDSLEKAMQEHDYRLQASLYKEAIERRFQLPFGAAYYFFLRGKTYLKWEK